MNIIILGGLDKTELPAAFHAVHCNNVALLQD